MKLTVEQIADKEKGAKALHAALETVNDNIEELKKGNGKLSAEAEAKFDKIAGEISTAIQRLDVAEAKNKELEKANKELEAAIARNPNAKAADVDRAKELQAKAMDQFLRFGSTKGKASSGNVNLAEFLDEFIASEKIEAKDIFGTSLETKAGTSLRVSSDADGGFLVLPQFGGVLQTQLFETSPIRAYASVETIASDALEFVDDYDQVTSGWVEETAPRPDTGTPQLAKRRIPVFEQYANVKVTQKQLDDGILNIEGWVTGKISDKLGRTENNAFVAGDGVGKPRGFTSYAAGSTSYAQDAIEQVNSGSTSTWTYAGLVNLIGAMKLEYLARAVFFTHRAGLTALLKIVDGQQRPIFSLNFEKNTRTFGTMLGLPVAVFNDMPAITTNSLSGGIADFSQAYKIVDRIGVRLLRDPYTAKPYVQMYATKRVGGDVANWEAMKLSKFNT